MIKVSEAASKKICELKQNEGHGNNVFLRVRVKRGGCSGFSYKMDFDSETGSEDKSFMVSDVKLVVDSQSLLYVFGYDS